MSHKRNKLDPIKDQKAVRKLADDLNAVNGKRLPTSVDNEMLSLIVDEAIKGVDISRRYPAFYKKLLDNPDLRSAFLNSIESIEVATQNKSIALPDVSNLKLGFLAKLATKPTITKVREKWRVIWQRTIEQLQVILSPSQLAYRSDTISFEDPWFTLMRSEIEVEEAIYTIALECTLSEQDNSALSPLLNLAVTLGMADTRTRFPVLSTLQWGTYHQTISIQGEGRARFPDIPFSTIFDSKNENITAELKLTIEPAM